jgi:fucose permease
MSTTASRGLLLLIAYLGFISLGLPDTLIGVAWPNVRDTFGLPQTAAAVIFFGTGLSYFCSSFFTGRLLSWMGVGMLLATSSALVAVSNFGYALAPVWGLFALCSIIHGVGSGAIDAGLNHYVARHFSARQMNWLHGCYSVGATFGPVIMTTVLALHGSWRVGYFTVALILALLTLLFVFTRRRWDDRVPAAEDAPPAPVATLGETLQQPIARLQVVIFFVYTGIEATVGQWSFTVLTESRGLSEATAGLWVSLYWGSIAAGRFLFGFVADTLGIDRLLRWCIVAVVAGCVTVAANLGGAFTMGALILVGLGLAPVYPCLMTRTPQRLGPAFSAHAIGLQVSSAMLGVAALPSLAGYLGKTLGLEAMIWMSVVIAALLLGLHELLLRMRLRP